MDMKLNPRYKSFYFNDKDELPEIKIDPAKTCLLVMNMQEAMIGRISDETEWGKESGYGSTWKDFMDRLDYITIPCVSELLAKAREKGIKVAYGTISNFYTGEKEDPIIAELKPQDGDRIYTRSFRPGKSIAAGTSFIDDMKADGIETVVIVGMATDQCISSSIRVLSDEDFEVICVEDACASDSLDQQEWELRALNFTYCLVVSQLQMMDILG